MELSLTKSNYDLIPVDENGDPKYTDIHGYYKVINTKPRRGWIKTNSNSNGAKYIPIGIVEQLLREVYPFWQAEQVGEPKILGNSVVISVNLKVFNPIIGQWLNYPGVGAVPIEVKKGSAPLDFQNINSKALHKNVPAALSFAISNAAKKIGPLFGSHINRGEDESLPSPPKSMEE